MVFTHTLCLLAIFANTPSCREWTRNSTSIMATTTSVPSLNTTRKINPLAPERLESIKNSYSELNLLSKTKPSDFIFDFNTAITGISRGTGGKTIAATSANFPGLINHGISMTIGFLGPCGINLPHTHPRATEINYSVDGDFVIGFYQENGAEFVLNELHKNQVAVFPKGAIHFEQNLNCVPATFIAAFNSEDPGVLTISDAFFGGLPATIAGATLGGLNITTVEDIRLKLAKNPSIGIEECRRRCGL